VPRGTKQISPRRNQRIPWTSAVGLVLLIVLLFGVLVLVSQSLRSPCAVPVSGGSELRASAVK
jgi:hypothetical protein